jgi:alpha-glucosidase
MAFTRLIAGPMDYHLGGFRAVPKADFKAVYIGPHVMGTRCHHLAMYVCFDNPNPMVADYPAAYEGQPGFDFIKAVPTWWDETRVVTADVGKLLITARRRGQTWYLGGMAAKPAPALEVPLTFLGTGHYQVTIWKDAADSAINPNHLAFETFTAESKDLLRVKTVEGGGFVAQFSPADK